MTFEEWKVAVSKNAFLQDSKKPRTSENAYDTLSGDSEEEEVSKPDTEKKSDLPFSSPPPSWSLIKKPLGQTPLSK